MAISTHTVKASARREGKIAPIDSAPLLYSIWSSLAQDSQQGYVDLYEMPLIERAGLVKSGVPSLMVGVISAEMDITKERFVRMMGLPRATVARKIANKSDLSVDESERLVGIAKLIGQVETIVKQSGNPEGFRAGKWFSEWISEPAAALGGRKPEDLLDTADGREAIAKLLAQMQSGAYA